MLVFIVRRSTMAHINNSDLARTKIHQTNAPHQVYFMREAAWNRLGEKNLSNRHIYCILQPVLPVIRV